MSDVVDTSSISSDSVTHAAVNWPERYQPEWFAEKTIAHEDVFTAVYSDLRLIARQLLNKEFGHPSIQATELVNEAFIKLLHNPIQSKDKRHLLNILARYMRQVLIDRGRRRRSIKRDMQLTQLKTDSPFMGEEPDWVLFDQALDRLNKAKPILHEVFQLHYFADIQLIDIARIIDCSDRTVKRYWMAAKLWLIEHIA